MLIAKKNRWLEYNQTGGRKDISDIEIASLNELIIESHRITK